MGLFWNHHRNTAATITQAVAINIVY